MSQSKPSDPGYRGALPPKNDWLARGWVVVVILIFLSLFALAALNVPTLFLPEPSVVPVPSVSAEPSGSAAPSGSGEASGAPSPSP